MTRRPQQLSLDTGPGESGVVGRARLSKDDRSRQALELSRNRLLVTYAVFAMLFAVLAGRLVHVTWWRGGEPALAWSGARDGDARERADIVDRNGVLLATNLGTASLYANPRVIMDAERAAAKLGAVLPDVNEAKLLTRLKSDRTFVWLKRNLTPKQQYAVNSFGLPGLAFQREQRRVYPHGSLAAHVLGFTGVDNVGLAGIEKYFDEALANRRADEGPLALTLDIRVQHALRTELARTVAEFRAKGGAGVVLDVRTGEVLGLVSLPDFDPNQIAAAGGNARFNRATLAVYELGSVFKIFTMATAIDKGTVDLSSGYDATKPIRVARFTIRDDHAKKRWLSVPEIFIYSSNIGAAKMAMDVGAESQRAYLDRLGLLSRSDVELPEVSTPLYPSTWRDVNTMTIAFGHGIAVSPLQVASAAAAVVNGGILMPATLIPREADRRPRGKRVMSPKTSAILRRLMRLAVVHGTGKQAEAEGYLVGGKTGTAEKVGAGGYQGKALISSFVGVFPMSAPRYLVLVLLDEPKGTKATFNFATGGWTAAPAVSRVVRRIAPLLGVEPVDEAASDSRRNTAIIIDGRKVKLASF